MKGLSVWNWLNLLAYYDYVQFCVNDIASSFFTDKEYLIVFVDHVFLIRSSVVGHLGWFYNFAIANKAGISKHWCESTSVMGWLGLHNDRPCHMKALVL